jgi:hypothetical protein
MSASAAPLSGPCEAHCPFRPLSRWLWGFRLFRSYGGLCSNRETGRSTCSLLSGFGRSLFPVLDSPHNGFKRAPPGASHPLARPTRFGFRYRVRQPGFDLSLSSPRGQRLEAGSELGADTVATSDPTTGSLQAEHLLRACQSSRRPPLQLDAQGNKLRLDTME